MIPLPEPQKVCWIGYELFTAYQMHTYAAACVAAERERCAKVCNEVAAQMTAYCPSAAPGWWPDQVGYACIQAIRAGSAGGES